MRRQNAATETNRPEYGQATDEVRRGRERRLAPRFPTSAPCRLSVFDGVDHLRGAGILRDVSVQGLGIRTELHCLPGMTVEILIGNEVILGEIRHCTSNEAGTYDVGVL